MAHHNTLAHLAEIASCNAVAEVPEPTIQPEPGSQPVLEMAVGDRSAGRAAWLSATPAELAAGVSPSDGCESSLPACVSMRWGAHEGEAVIPSLPTIAQHTCNIARSCTPSMQAYCRLDAAASVLPPTVQPATAAAAVQPATALAAAEQVGRVWPNASFGQKHWLEEIYARLDWSRSGGIGRNELVGSLRILGISESSGSWPDVEPIL